MFGYHANATKIWFITKDPHLAKARVLSQDTQVNITSQGRPHLGTTLGSQEFVDQYVTDKVLQWNKELLLLVDVPKIQPHTAYTAFIHGYIHKFSYLSRTIPSIDRLLQPLEDCICSQLIPALTGRAPPSLVMSLTGGLGNTAKVCYKRLASLLSSKWDQPYSSTITWIRCSLLFPSYALQCSA